MRGFVSFVLASVVALSACVLSTETASAQGCNVNSSAAASASNSPAILQNQAVLQSLLQAQAQQRALSSAAVAAPPRIAFAPIVQAPVGATATATAGSFAVPAPAVDPVALAQALATFQSLNVSPLATVQAVGVGSCSVGRSRSLAVSRNSVAPLARIASLAPSRSVARSRSVTRN